MQDRGSDVDDFRATKLHSRANGGPFSEKDAVVAVTARFASKKRHVLRGIRVDLFGPREPRRLGAQPERIGVILVRVPLNDDVRRFVQAGTGIDFFAPISAFDDPLAGIRMPPIVESIDQVGPQVLIFLTWLDDS